MNKYVQLIDNSVITIVDEFDPDFPGIPIGERYPAEFLNQCKVYSEEVFIEKEIRCGMMYDPATDTYYEPQPEPEPTPESETPIEEE